MIQSSIYDGIVEKIQDVYASCSPIEQKQLLNILKEIAVTGDSATLENIWLTDFKEVPVSMDRFLSDPYYMGATNRNGEGVYPYWRSTMNDIFNHGNQYNEIILSGATRIGKSSTMVSIMAYMLYRLMLYRDPHGYFGLKPVSRFTVAFANLTKELAYGVAYREFQDTLKDIPFFQEHGSFSRSDRNYYYIPEGDKIDIVAGSDAANFLGMQVWCLSGDTEIIVQPTSGKGWSRKTLRELDGKVVRVLQLNPNTAELDWSEAAICQTGVRNVLVELTVVDKCNSEYSKPFTIEGTIDHKLMMADMTYKELSQIKVGDQLLANACPDSGIIAQHYAECIVTHIEWKVYNNEPVYDVIDAKPHHNFIIYNSNHLLVSHNCAGMDETNFARSGIKDITLAKARMKSLYDTVNARVSGTFRVGGQVYGKLIAASSKNTDNDFLSDHIETQLSAGNDHLYLVDEPQWVILPKSRFSEEKFHFTVGDRYKRGFVIAPENDDEAHRKEYEEMGYKVMEAPAELRKNFLADYDIALRDIAGISVAGAMGFITQEMVTPCIAQDRQNPFFEDILEIGVRDTGVEIYQFYHDEVVPNELKYQRMNIHIDLGETHDRIGMSGSCVCGSKIIETEEGKKVSMPFIKQVFTVGIQAPRGDRLSFQKAINFVIWLRQHHYNVGTVSTDNFQSDFVREVLAQQNFEVAKYPIGTSMEPYIGLRNLLVDQRIELVKCQQQEDELIATQRSNNRIEHPREDEHGHGDLADGLCGSAYSLIVEKTSARPPAKQMASIARAVNTGTRPINSTTGQPVKGTIPLLHR